LDFGSGCWRGRRERTRREARAPSGHGGGRGERAHAPGPTGAPRPGGADGTPFLLVLAIAAAVAVAIRFLVLPRLRRRADRTPTPADAVVELRRALERLGWRLPLAVTLSDLEPRLAEAAGPPAARYARRLRELRYAAHGESAPTRLDRRALRRSLTAGRGLVARVRGLWALPPAPVAGLLPPTSGGTSDGRAAGQRTDGPDHV